MKNTDIEKRLTALERAIKRLKSGKAGQAKGAGRWWTENAGRFAGDDLFQELVRLGREYRDLLRPGRARRKK